MELVCIRCPRGCHLTVTKNKKGETFVVGNSCPRGEEYGKQETTHPVRTITTIVKTKTGTISLVSEQPVDKNLFFDVLKEIKNSKIPSTPKLGSVFISNVLNTGVNIIISGINEA